jgi:hypothetical protein
VEKALFLGVSPAPEYIFFLVVSFHTGSQRVQGIAGIFWHSTRIFPTTAKEHY